jgi:serine O-acetyltransferase
MIKTKEDLKYYLEEDAKQIGYSAHPSLKQRIARRFLRAYNLQFMVSLRHYEYHLNNSGLYHKVMTRLYLRRMQGLRAKTGIELPPNVAGPGLHVSHSKIVVSAYSKIGCNCKILSDVTLGGGRNVRA